MAKRRRKQRCKTVTVRGRRYTACAVRKGKRRG